MNFDWPDIPVVALLCFLAAVIVHECSGVMEQEDALKQSRSEVQRCQDLVQQLVERSQEVPR